MSSKKNEQQIRDHHVEQVNKKIREMTKGLSDNQIIQLSKNNPKHIYLNSLDKHVMAGKVFESDYELEQFLKSLLLVSKSKTFFNKILNLFNKTR